MTLLLASFFSQFILASCAVGTEVSLPLSQVKYEDDEDEFISLEILFSQDEQTPAVIGCGGLGSLLFLASLGICIWVAYLIHIVYFPKV